MPLVKIIQRDEFPISEKICDEMKNESTANFKNGLNKSEISIASQNHKSRVARVSIDSSHCREGSIISCPNCWNTLIHTLTVVIGRSWD